MNQELVFETRQHHTVVRADSLHAHLGIVTQRRLWVMMHTAAGNAQSGLDVFHLGSPESACWSLDYAAEICLLEGAPEVAGVLRSRALRSPALRA